MNLVFAASAVGSLLSTKKLLSFTIKPGTIIFKLNKRAHKHNTLQPFRKDFVHLLRGCSMFSAYIKQYMGMKAREKEGEMVHKR